MNLYYLLDNPSWDYLWKLNKFDKLNKFESFMGIETFNDIYSLLYTYDLEERLDLFELKWIMRDSDIYLFGYATSDSSVWM